VHVWAIIRQLTNWPHALFWLRQAALLISVLASIWGALSNVAVASVGETGVWFGTNERGECLYRLSSDFVGPVSWKEIKAKPGVMDLPKRSIGKAPLDVERCQAAKEERIGSQKLPVALYDEMAIVGSQRPSWVSTFIGGYASRISTDWLIFRARESGEGTDKIFERYGERWLPSHIFEKDSYSNVGSWVGRGRINISAVWSNPRAIGFFGGKPSIPQTANEYGERTERCDTSPACNPIERPCGAQLPIPEFLFVGLVLYGFGCWLVLCGWSAHWIMWIIRPVGVLIGASGSAILFFVGANYLACMAVP
jgi:hypothetical protein